MLYKDEALLIRSMDYGEGHKILTLYTLQRGKVSVMARGARKLKSRHTGATQLFTHAEYTYYKSSKMGTLNHAEIIHSHEELRTDLDKTAYASYLAEMIYRLITDDDPGSEFLFGQLAAAMQELAEGKDLQIVTHIFELKLLRYTGYEPVLSKCSLCGSGEKLEHFDAGAGGMVCRACAASYQHQLRRIDDKTLRLLRVLQKVDLRNVGNIAVTPQTKLQLDSLMRSFMDYHTDASYWKSRKFLDQMEKYFQSP